MFLDLFPPFIVGLIGSLHCLGMCGPLIVAYSLQLSGTGTAAVRAGVKAGMWHHFVFHAGRLATYGFLGALAAGIFYLANLTLFFKQFRGGLTLVGGVLMILLGLVLLKVFPLPCFLMRLCGEKGIVGRVSSASLLRGKQLTSKIGLGVATGFLPCGLSWAMIAKAAATQNIPLGFLTMVAFGLGTVPVLFLTGVTASFISVRTRLLGERIAALSVILMGLILVFKGGRIFV
jgi:sulfite exporter TauE/SafE